MNWNAAAGLPNAIWNPGALATAMARSRWNVLEFVVGQLCTGGSRFDLALRTADGVARLAGGEPCLVALDAAGGEEALLASSSGRVLPVEILSQIGPLSLRPTSRRWIAAQRLGYGADDPPVRLAAQIPVSPPGAHDRSIGLLLVFERKGGDPLDPEALAGARILASLTGSVLAARAPTAHSDDSTEVERLRILAELHDGLFQNLYGLELEIEAAISRPGCPPAARTAARRWRQVLAAAIDETRSVLERLDGSEANVPALGAGLDMLAAEVAAVHGVDMDTQIVMESEVPVPAEIRRGVLAIAQEAVRNSVRHSGSRKVGVLLEVDAGGLQLVVEDHGVGFVPTEVGRGHGLRSMAARASGLGGSLDVTSRPGDGVRVALWAPVARYERTDAQQSAAGGRGVAT